MTNLKNLPAYWRKKIKNYLLLKGESRTTFNICDFDSMSTIVVKFEDGSLAAFKYAFSIQLKEKKEIGVFTEHCGYYIFPAEMVEIHQVTR